jgi:hypothetical protein
VPLIGQLGKPAGIFHNEASLEKNIIAEIETMKSCANLVRNPAAPSYESGGRGRTPLLEKSLVKVRPMNHGVAADAGQ